MRICLVSNEFAPFAGAGIGTYAANMAAAWAASGHEVHVLTGPHPGVLEDGPRLRPGVRFHAVDPEGGPGREGIGTRAERYALGVLSALERLHGAHPFDYVEFPDYGGEGAYAMWARAAWGTLGGAVLGVRLHTPTRECRALNGEAWLDEEAARAEALEDASIRSADVVISPSTSLLAMVRQRLGGGWGAEAVVPYPFGAEAVRDLSTGADEPGPTGPGAGASAAAPTILYYGRLERRKGVETLVRAGLLLADTGARTVFIGGDTDTAPGGGSMRAHLERLIPPAQRDRFRFEGPRPRRELGGAIRGATVVCVPSLWENYPNVVLESMALGACVVGSNAGGIGEIIREGVDGLLFRPGDAEDLARALGRALGDAGLRDRLGAAAQARIADVCDPARVVAATVGAVERARAMRGEVEAGGRPGVAVVISTGPGAPGLERTLHSIVAQSVVPECIVLSRAAGADVASIAARAMPGVRVEEAGPLCAGAARNAVLPLSRSRWAMFLETGDVLHPRCVERLAAAAARNPDAASILPLARWEGGGGAAPFGLDLDLLASGPGPGAGLVNLSLLPDGCACDGEIDDGRATDWDMICRIALAGGRAVIAPEALVERPRGRIGVQALRIIAAHPRLAGERALRIVAARAEAERAARENMARQFAEGTGPHVEADNIPGPRRVIRYEAVYRQKMMEANLRYRIADRVNRALKAAGVQRPLKVVATRLRGLGRRPRG